MSEGEWEFDDGGVIHRCFENYPDGDPAVEVTSHLWTVGDEVREQKTYLCVPCKATTAAVHDWPAWMLEEPR